MAGARLVVEEAPLMTVTSHDDDGSCRCRRGGARASIDRAAGAGGYAGRVGIEAVGPAVAVEPAALEVRL
jgi:hypothetical protein